MRGIAPWCCGYALFARGIFTPIGVKMPNVLIEEYGRNRQTLWGGRTDANPKLLQNDI